MIFAVTRGTAETATPGISLTRCMPGERGWTASRWLPPSRLEISVTKRRTTSSTPLQGPNERSARDRMFRSAYEESPIACLSVQSCTPGDVRAPDVCVDGGDRVQLYLTKWKERR